MSHDALTHTVPSPPPETAAQRRDRAIQVLELSRAQIQAELTGDTPGHHSSPWDVLGLFGQGNARRGLWRLIRQRLRMGRAGRAVLGVVERWWEHHPLRLPLTVVGQQIESHMPPLVRRHPAACTAMAAVTGFALIHWRHWWWPRVTLGMRRLPRRLMSLLWLELAHPQVQASLLGALMAGEWMSQDDDGSDAANDDASSDDVAPANTSEFADTEPAQQPETAAAT